MELLKNFVPAADEVWSLQKRDDPEGRLFQTVAEQGHYAGRRWPTDTRQGTYAAAPSGVLLASANTNDPRAMADMLRKALDKWRSMSRSERLSARAVAEADSPNRNERMYPSGGLVLRSYVRDLPRSYSKDDWRTRAWNTDMLWFRSEEANQFIPAESREGAKARVPDSLARRLASTNLIDIVRGQSVPFRQESIRECQIESTVVRVRGDVRVLRLSGKVVLRESGRWPVAGFQDMNSATEQERGYDGILYGEAEWDGRSSRFTKFELLAIGTRWGGTQYNQRHDDLGRAPIGHLFVLAKPEDRVAPANIWTYGWR